MDKEVFYKCVHCNVLSEFLKNVLDQDGIQQIIKKMTPYAFGDPDDGSLSFDGSLMLWFVVTKIYPTIIVGVETHRQKLETMKLHKYKNNVSDMCKAIELHYNCIIALKSTCESIVRYTINALLSGPNDNFNMWVGRVKTDIESRTGPHKDDTYLDVIDAARAIYINMEESGEWDKVNPREAKLIALSTELEKLKKDNIALASIANKSDNTASNTNKNGGGNARTGTAAGSTKIVGGGLEEWRTINKGLSVVHFGKTFWWCPKHKHPQGHWNGLYCTHKPEDHDEWRNNRNRNNRPNGNSDAASEKGNDEKKLAINSRLKEVLCSKLMLTDEDADKICNEVNQSN